MIGIILAAGRGSRLGPLTQSLPKAMVEVQGQFLIDYAIDFLKGEPIQKIYVLAGYRYDTLRNYIQNKGLNQVSILENTEYGLGSIVTLSKLINQINEDFVLMNVDHIYSKQHHRPVVVQVPRGLEVFCDFGRELKTDDMKVVYDSNTRTLKRIDKSLSNYNAGYVGLTRCSRIYLQPYRETLWDLLAENPNLNVESILARLAQRLLVEVLDLGSEPWFEIDTIQDIQRFVQEQVQSKTI